MNKKVLSFLLLAVISAASFNACKKHNDTTADPTRNYFPLTLGKSVTYNVDSIYYNEATCSQYRTKSQLKYVVTDTFTDRKNYKDKLTYIMDVFSRPYEGATWRPHSVIILNPTSSSLNWSEEQVKYVMMSFPIKEGAQWKGNQFAPVTDSDFAYLKNWNYQYRDVHKSYNTGYVNFDNTVSVLEVDESINYPDYDSLVVAARNFSKAVYAYNVGLVYRELTHWTYKGANNQCVEGYSVVMKAVDHN